MSGPTQTRIDEVAKYYEPAVKIEAAGKYVFVLIAIISLCIPYSAKFNASAQNILQIIFIVIVAIYFGLSQLLRFYLIPGAERMRRKQLLSNAFGVTLTHDQTQLYYNNEYTSSVIRLGANIMENSLFSKEITGKMLLKSRIITGGYIVAWIAAFALRHNDLDLLIWITQLVFSGEIIAQWISLEVLHFRYERTYEQLHTHFLHETGEDSQRAIATILDAFVEYEAAKSAAGLLLPTKIFNKINPALTVKWEQIRKDLKMNSDQHTAPHI